MTIVWNAQRVSAGLSEIEIARPVVLGRVKQLLDDYHGIERSTRYYDILLGDWCERFLHLVYVATQKLQDVDCDSQEISKTVELVAPSDTAEYFSDYPTLPTTTLATLRALNKSGTSGIEFSTVALTIRSFSTVGRRNRVIAKLLQLVSWGNSPKVVFVKPFASHIPKKWIASMISWRLWAKHDDMDIEINTIVSPDVNWRQQNISAIDSSSSLVEVAQAIISAHLPACVVEGFSAIRSQMLSARPNRPEHIYSSQSLWTHFAFKVLAAEWCEQGTKLHYQQHGGWYGLDELHVLERYERRVSDIYYTWGWSRGDSNTRPLSPAKSRNKTRRHSYDSLICFDQPSQIYRLQYFPLPGTLETMYIHSAIFVKLRKSKKALKIRLFPGDYGSAHREAILFARPDAVFGISGDIFSQYSASRLVIHGYLGTSWLETLGNDIPTVCFYDPAAYRFRSDAQPLLDDLSRVGILHTSGRSAAEHVNRIDGDIQSWWLSTDVQSARRAFADQFANFSDNWQLDWEQEFTRELKL